MINMLGSHDIRHCTLFSKTAAFYYTCVLCCYCTMYYVLHFLYTRMHLTAVICILWIKFVDL